MNTIIPCLCLVLCIYLSTYKVEAAHLSWNHRGHSQRTLPFFIYPQKRGPSNLKYVSQREDAKSTFCTVIGTKLICAPKKVKKSHPEDTSADYDQLMDFGSLKLKLPMVKSPSGNRPIAYQYYDDSWRMERDYDVDFDERKSINSFPVMLPIKAQLRQITERNNLPALEPSQITTECNPIFSKCLDESHLDEGGKLDIGTEYYDDKWDLKDFKASENSNFDEGFESSDNPALHPELTYESSETETANDVSDEFPHEYEELLRNKPKKTKKRFKKVILLAQPGDEQEPNNELEESEESSEEVSDAEKLNLITLNQLLADKTYPYSYLKENPEIVDDEIKNPMKTAKEPVTKNIDTILFILKENTINARNEIKELEAYLKPLTSRATKAYVIGAHEMNILNRGLTVDEFLKENEEIGKATENNQIANSKETNNQQTVSPGFIERLKNILSNWYKKTKNWFGITKQEPIKVLLIPKLRSTKSLTRRFEIPFEVYENNIKDNIRKINPNKNLMQRYEDDDNIDTQIDDYEFAREPQNLFYNNIDFANIFKYQKEHSKFIVPQPVLDYEYPLEGLNQQDALFSLNPYLVNQWIALMEDSSQRNFKPLKLSHYFSAKQQKKQHLNI